ncbi:MAG: GMC family oxidoreductase N-terminal domain-containing protein [Thermoleophilia bacterium]|nr:GMC family oxidoreductase N-terminal domain-containing protein [Thermoleophilia bacterium]
MPGESREYDYVIVGGGTAGCLLANRLTERGDATVALVEAGGRDRYPWIHIPIGYHRCHGNPRVDWCSRTDPVEGLNGRDLVYPRGRVLGGGSSINGMIFMRGSPLDYDHWAALGNTGWSWEDVLPLFLRHEDQYAIEPEEFGGRHRRGGELRVEGSRIHWDVMDVFRAAAEQAGYTWMADLSHGDREGLGPLQANQRAGLRWSSARAFLRPARHRPNLDVLTHTTVEQVLIEDHRAVALRIRRDGIEDLLPARREIILAAGVVGTPQLLQLSGIGPGELLQEHGIPVLLDRPAIGENFQDHLQIRCAFELSGITTLNETSRTLPQKARIALRYAIKRSGPMAMPPAQVGMFARSDPDRERPNLQFHVQAFSMEGYRTGLDAAPGMTTSVCNIQPTSRGYVRITSRRSSDHPTIQPNYLGTDADRAVAADAIRLARLIISQPAFRPYAPREIRPGANWESTEDLAREAGNIGTTIFHGVGTCRMGVDPDAVVDPQLRVHGIERLRIADASIMPTITSGNTNAPVCMIAEKAADLIRAGG